MKFSFLLNDITVRDGLEYPGDNPVGRKIRKSGIAAKKASLISDTREMSHLFTNGKNGV